MYNRFVKYMNRRKFISGLMAASVTVAVAPLSPPIPDFTSKDLNVDASVDDADFLESMKFTQDEICRVFNVPPYLLGDLEKSNYANAESMNSPDEDKANTS